MPNEFIARNGIIALNNSTITGSLNVSGNITTPGTLTVQTIVAQTITSSTDFITGSTKFGSTTANTHQFTGSILQSGSLAYFAGSVGIGTASPLVKLDLRGDEYVSGYLVGFDVNPLSNYAYRFTNDGGNSFINVVGGNLGIGTTTATSKLYIRDGSNTNLRLYGSSGVFVLSAENDAGSAQIPLNLNNAVRIASDGNVGIGTTSPSSKLHVSVGNVDGIRVQSSNSGYLEIGKTNGARWRWTNEYNAANILELLVNDLAGGTPGQNVLTVSGSGNVGIGVIAPNFKLQVAGTGYYSDNLTTAGYVFTNGEGLATSLRVGGIYGNLGLYVPSTYNMQFDLGWDGAFVFTRGNTTRVYIKHDGNVGIGTTSPATLLHLQQSSGPTIRLVRSSNRFDITGDTDFMELNARDASTYMVFKTVDTERMRITSGGVVSVATTSPYTSLSTRLYVGYNQDSSVVNQNEFISVGAAGGSTNIAGINFLIYNGGYGGRIYTDDRTASVRGLAFDVLDGGTFYNAISITRTSSPNVGIGTTSPGYKLDVVQTTNDTYIRAKTTTAGAYFIADSATDGYYGYSLYNGTTEKWFIGGYGSTDLGFSLTKGGTQYMTILRGNGNVGIGTTSPDSKFHMGLSNGSQIRFNYAGSGDNYYDGVTHYFRNGSGAANVMTLLNGGSVGIGTTSPLSKLQVSSGFITAGNQTSVAGSIILQGYYGDGSLVTLGGEYSNGGPVLGYAVTPSTSAAEAFVSSTGINVSRGAYVISGNIHRWHSGGGQVVSVGGAVTMTEKMRLDASGNLGIGTTSPGYLLDVWGGPGDVARFKSVNSAESLRAYLGSSYKIFQTSDNDQFGYVGTQFYITTNGGSERLRINNSGCVGIGTTSPITQLHIQSSGNEPGLAITSTATGGRTYRIFTNPAWATGSFQIYDTTADASRIYINSSGNVGIDVGASNPAYKLDIAGSLRSTTSAYFATTSGNVGIGTTNPGSSKVAIQSDWVSGNGTIKVYPSTAFSSGGSAGYTIFDSNGTTRKALFAANSTQVEVWAQQNTPMVFATNDTERMRIDSGGNVGIGTTNPQVGLHLYNSELRIRNADNNITHFNYSNGSTNYVRGITYFDQASVYFTGGNIGIGTTSPASLLHVYSTSGSPQGITITGGDETFVKFLNSTTKSWGFITTTQAASDFGIYQSTSAGGDPFSAGTARLYFNGDGNVGIGTTSLSATLTVSKAASNYMFDLENASETGFKLRTYNHGSGTAPGLVFTQGIYYGTQENAAIKFYRGGSGTGGFLAFTVNDGTERMRIDVGGNVGIGTTNPTGSFHVAGATTTLGSMQIVATVGGGPSAAVTFKPVNAGSVNTNYIFELNPNGGAYGYFAVNNVDPGINQSLIQLAAYGLSGDSYINVPQTSQNFSLRVNTSTKFYLQGSSGNVGIGTTSPSATLQVSLATVNSPSLRIGQSATTNNSYGDWVGIEFMMSNEVSQFTGNPAARIATYLEGDNNRFGLRFWTRTSAGLS